LPPRGGRPGGLFRLPPVTLLPLEPLLLVVLGVVWAMMLLRLVRGDDHGLAGDLRSLLGELDVDAEARPTAAAYDELASLRAVAPLPER